MHSLLSVWSRARCDLVLRPDPWTRVDFISMVHETIDKLVVPVEAQGIHRPTVVRFAVQFCTLLCGKYSWLAGEQNRSSNQSSTNAECLTLSSAMKSCCISFVNQIFPPFTKWPVFVHHLWDITSETHTHPGSTVVLQYAHSYARDIKIQLNLNACHPASSTESGFI